jgi:hypothetical protein
VALHPKNGAKLGLSAKGFTCTKVEQTHKDTKIKDGKNSKGMAFSF